MGKVKIYEIDPQQISKMHFITDVQLVETREEFRSAEEALRSPLAAKLFGFPWAEAVTLDTDRVILEKADWVEWEDLSDPLAQLISDHLESGEPILFKASVGGERSTPVGSEDSELDWDIQILETPNPATLKFQANRQIAEQTRQFDEATETQSSPLAEKLFGFPWTESVFIGHDFVSVTKADWVQWEALAEPLGRLIVEHLQSKSPVLVNITEADESSDDSDEVRVIKQVLNQEIRPAVAMDGGDILFQRYEDQVVYLHMRGACAGCPSSTMTLKMGIEQRLREAVPEIKEVVAI